MGATVELLEGGVLDVRLARPEQRNALNVELLEAVNAGLGKHLRSGRVQAVVLQGSGGYFSAGADLKEMAEAREGGEEGRKRLRRAMSEFVYLMTELRTAPVPTVALVEGGASGGGVGLLGSCQWVVATRGAAFRLPEAQLGLFPYMISPVLIRRMGLQAFLRLTFEGRTLRADEAQQAGLVDELVEALPDPAAAAVGRSARPDTVWPTGPGAGDPAQALETWTQVPEPLQRAARTAVLLHDSMSLPIAMRTAAAELSTLVERLGEGG
jgi:enoyl-CoA hydratase/carnithine racemase